MTTLTGDDAGDRLALARLDDDGAPPGAAENLTASFNTAPKAPATV
jgi:hypothetical protein